MINVMLADHQRIFRTGMACALAAEDDIRIVGQPHSIGQVLHGLKTFQPHVLVLSSAYLTRMDAIRQICDSQHTAVLLMEDCGEVEIPQFSPEVQGVVQRSEDVVTVVRCIRHLARGGRVLRLVHNRATEDRMDDPVGIRVRQRLTPHELRIIAFVLQGFKNRKIALRMITTEAAIKNSLRKIFDKTGVFDRLELALYVLHHGALMRAAAEVEPTPDMRSLMAAHPEWRTAGRSIVN